MKHGWLLFMMLELIEAHDCDDDLLVMVGESPPGPPN